MRHTRKTNGGVSFATPEDVVRRHTKGCRSPPHERMSFAATRKDVVRRHTKGCRSPPHERMSEVTPSDGDLPHRGR
jgi:hypothetical protein